jgi:CheY-like chemotaxis protein
MYSLSAEKARKELSAEKRKMKAIALNHFYTILADQDQLVILENNQTNLNALLNKIQLRINSGESAQWEKNIIDEKILSSNFQIESLKQDLTNNINSIKTLLGTSIDFSLEGSVLDMQMPDITGLDLMERLEKIGFTTPIIFLSGQSHPQEIVKGLKKGALDFLFKPFNLEELLNAIRDALEYDQKQFSNKLSQLFPRKTFHQLAPQRSF